MSEAQQYCVTAAEITRNFGMWQDRARDAPVVVTHHGRPRCVLLSANSFNAMRQPENLEARISQIGLEQSILAERIDAGFLVLDQLLNVTIANTFASMLFETARDMLTGARLSDLIPDFADSVVEAQLRRALRSREAIHTSVVLNNQQMHLHAFAWPGGLAMTIKPSEGEERSEQMEAENAAFRTLIQMDERVGVATLTVRGTLSKVDEGFASVTGLDAQRLQGTRMLELILRHDRALVGEAIEAVFRGSKRDSVDASLLNNNGEDVPIRILLAALHDRVEHGMMVMIQKRGA
jgi:PAS domain S-box-containing protein